MSINNYITIMILLFIFSCEGNLGPAGDDETGGASNIAHIELSMVSENSSHALTISVKNFSPISKIIFNLGYNYNVFTVFPASLVVSSSAPINIIENNNMLEFLYETDISGDEELITIDFTGPAQPEDEVFRLRNILILDSSNSPVYYTCSDPSYKDPQQCSNNGATWSNDTKEFHPKSICFIDRHPTNESIVFDGFAWRNYFCDGISTPW